MKKTIAKILFWLTVLSLCFIGFHLYFFGTPLAPLDFIRVGDIKTPEPEAEKAEKPNTVEELREEEKVVPPKPEEVKIDKVPEPFSLTAYFLIKKFLLDVEYSKELEEIKSARAPDPVSSVIGSLSEYNEKYLKSPVRYKKSIIPENSFLSKFLTINKDEGILKGKNESRREIIENLGPVEDFFFGNRKN